MSGIKVLRVKKKTFKSLAHVVFKVKSDSHSQIYSLV